MELSLNKNGRRRNKRVRVVLHEVSYEGKKTNYHKTLGFTIYDTPIEEVFNLIVGFLKKEK
jgi:hypothetical protein